MVYDEVIMAVANGEELDKKRETRFFLDKFFPSGDAIGTNYVRLLKSVDEHGIASFVLPREEAKVVGEPGYTSQLIEAPVIREKIIYTPEDLLELGAAPGSILRMSEGETTDQAAERRIARGLLKLRNRALRREEAMAIGALSGGWTYDDGEGVALDVDFAFPVANKFALAGGDIWGSTTEDKVGQLEDWIRVTEEFGGNVTDIVMGHRAYQRFITDTAVQELYDKNNIRIGALDNTNRTDRFARGTWGTALIHKVSEPVKLEDGSTINLVDQDGVWIISDAMETDKVYARIAILDPETNRPISAQTSIYSKEFVSGDDLQTLGLLYVSRPFPILANPGSVTFVETA